MSRTVRLRDIAHARSGDKGNDSNISVWFADQAGFDAARAQLTPELIKQELGGLVLGSVEIYPLPQLLGLNIVLRDALEGGVNSSLNLDGHGKSWSFLLLGLSIELSAAAPA